MKKSLLVVAAVATFLAASAEETFMSSKTLVAEKAVMATEVAAARPLKKAPAKAEAAPDVNGSYIAITMSRDTINSVAAPVFTVAESGEVSVVGLHGAQSEPVVGTYANGKITIAGGQVGLNHATYGPVALYQIVNEQGQYGTGDIVFQVYDDGSLSLTSGYGFLMLISSGSYKGYSIGTTTGGGYDALKPNGTIKSELVNADFTPATEPETEFPTYTEFFEVEGLKAGVVAGIDDMTWFNFIVNDDNTVDFIQAPSYYYSSSYKVAYPCKGVESATGTFSFYPKLAPTGTVDKKAGTLTMDLWGFYMQSATANSYANLNGRKASSVITFPGEQPEPTAITDVTESKAVKAQKVMENGQVLILVGDKKYNVMGAEVK